MMSEPIARDWLHVATPGFVPDACPACQARNSPTPSRKARKGSNPGPGENLIDETEPSWRLYHRPQGDRGSWRQILLRRAGSKHDGVRKWAYWLGWNGQRIALGRDAKTLLKHDPDIFAWVEIACSSHQWEPEQ